MSNTEEGTARECAKKKEMETIPPPRGVLGCGAFTIARPGVKICPLMIVKFTACAIVTVYSSATALVNRSATIRLASKSVNCVNA